RSSDLPRSPPTRGRGPSARICCGSSWASWRRPDRPPARTRRSPPSASASRGPSASSPPRRAARRCSTPATARWRSASPAWRAISVPWPSSTRPWRRAEAQAAIEDVARDLGRYARGIRSDPARLADVEERLFLLQRLCRKHGGTVADLAARQAALARELAELGSFEE